MVLPAPTWHADIRLNSCLTNTHNQGEILLILDKESNKLKPACENQSMGHSYNQRKDVRFKQQQKSTFALKYSLTEGLFC